MLSRATRYSARRSIFYAVSNYKIQQIETLKGEQGGAAGSRLRDGNSKPVEIQDRTVLRKHRKRPKENLEKELGKKSFETVKAEADATWEKLLSKIKVSGGTERQKELFYSSFYRSFLWPALRSDVNGEYTDEKGNVVKADFQYYTLPSLWDDYRNKLVLLGMISPGRDRRT